MIAEWLLAMSQPSFEKRWPAAIQPAMSLEMLITARKAAERPTGMTYTYCKWPNCKRS
jgi:hypothetical protein